MGRAPRKLEGTYSLALWILKFYRSPCCFDWLPANPLILCDHLRAQQQDQRSNLNAQEYGDRRGEGAVNKLDLRHCRVVPCQNMSHYFPKDRGGHTADQRMTQR